MTLSVDMGVQIDGRNERIVSVAAAVDITGYSVTITSKGASTDDQCPLTMGTVVTFRGRDYEVWSICTLDKSEGWGSTTFCVDLMKAAEKREEIRAHRAQVMTQLGLERFMGKSERLMDQGLG